MNTLPKIPAKTLYLDIETTGRHPPRDTLVEIGIVDDDGRTVLDTLVNPERAIGDAKRYTGISDELLRNAPTLRKLWPTLEAIFFGCHLVIFNSEHDRQFFPKRLASAGHVSCAMTRFAGIYGEWSAYHGSYTFKSLKTATDYIGYEWQAPRHRALPDALAVRALWRWMEDRDDFNELTLTDTNVVSLTVGESRQKLA